MTDNSDLRQEAANAITNYMHHELFEISKEHAGNMLPWMTEQGNAIMEMLDRAIANTKEEGKKRGLL